MNDCLKRLLEADQHCLAVAEVFLDNLADHPSLAGYRALSDSIDEARALARDCSPDFAFGRLLVRHLVASWDLLQAAARYRFSWPEMPVVELVETLGGAGAVTRLEKAVAEIDADAAWAYLNLRHGYRAGRVPADYPGARPLIEESAARLAGGFREWIASKGWELPGIDAEVVVGPNESGDSWYRPQRNLVVLGGAEFMVFERSNGLTVNPVIALRSLAHELTGHAVQDALSRDLPPALRPDDRSRLRFATLPAAEGYSTHATSMALAFAEELGSEHSIGDKDVKFLQKIEEMTVLHHALPALVSVVVARARQEDKFDPVAHIAERCGLPGLGEMLEAARNEPVHRLIYDNACFFGIQEVRRTAADLAARGVDRGAALRALGSGAWALGCYREAITSRVDAGADS